MNSSRLRLVVLALTAALCVVGCGDSQPGAAPTTAQGTTSTAAAPTTVASAEDRFVADVLDTPGLSTTMGHDDLVTVGGIICQAIPLSRDRNDLVSTMGLAAKYGAQAADILASAAEQCLCPTSVYGSDLPTVTAAPKPAGPLTSIPPGTYEVGTAAGQIAPGKYRSTGPDGSNSAGCYYARLKHNDGSANDIIDNNISKGQSLLTVKTSDGYVEVDGCTFTKA